MFQSLKRRAFESLARKAFGENMLVSGGDAASLCIGDVLQATSAKRGSAAQATSEPLRLQVTCPRRPCARIDMAHGKTFSKHGVRAHCSKTGCAGFFCRVLSPGAVTHGTLLEVVERPWPQYPIARVADLLYGIDGAADRAVYRLPGLERKTRAGTVGMGHGDQASIVASWRGSIAELRELAEMAELCAFEWRDELAAMRDAWDADLERKNTRCRLASEEATDDAPPPSACGVM